MKTVFLFFVFTLTGCALFAQINTFSPYSRYGIGELQPTTFAHNAGMGGAFIAHKPDSTMPIFINAGNPAAYSLIRLTSLEVGGTFHYSAFTEKNGGALNKWGTNFSYAALGFPIMGNGGMCFGITPYSFVGYNTKDVGFVDGIGNVSYEYGGSGGLNKAFLGYGVMPFSKRLIKFRTKRLYVPDSLRTIGRGQYKAREFGSKLLSDLAIGFNGYYVFGTISNTTRVVYPNPILYNNTYRERVTSLGDFTGNVGVQTGFNIDSIKDYQRKENQIKSELDKLKAEAPLTEGQLAFKRDSLDKVTPLYKRAFKERLKITFGYVGSINNTMRATYVTAAYNYILNAVNEEIVRDTALLLVNDRGEFRLPLEQGLGFGFKKGERINTVADIAITDWSRLKSIEDVSELVKNYRVSAGINFVPEKYAAGNGAFFRKVNYRIGVSYQTGYITFGDQTISTYFVSAGFGIPVGIGRLSSMVNVSGQYGRTGSSTSPLTEDFYRVIFGFTFSDRWFQKFRYD